MIPGGASHTTLDKINYVQAVVADPDRAEEIHLVAADALARIEAGSPVHPEYLRVREAEDDARTARTQELRRLADEALARIAAGKKRKSHRPAPSARVDEEWSARAFVLIWSKLDHWWLDFAPDALATDLADEQLETFFTVVDHTSEFADRLRTARAKEEPAQTARRLHVV